MIRNILYKSLLLLVLVSGRVAVNAQSLPVGMEVLEEYFRRQQLMIEADSTAIPSFAIRPLSPSPFSDSGSLYKNLYSTGVSWTSKDGKGFASLLPISMQMQYNSHHPYGWNDGSMIPAKGWQSQVSGGFFAEYGPLSIQLRPEVVVARNPAFEGFPTEHYEVIWARYYDFYNYIDLPERFGNKEYQKAYWGQSSVRLNYKSFSFGLSTENLWWGPGRRTSLLLSNTAPGFKHLTLNTRNPLKSKIGSFEGQLVAGRLEGSGFHPLPEDLEYFGDPLYIPKTDDWRYFSGITMSYQPRWVNGLFLGFSRSFQIYSEDRGKKLVDHLPIFAPFQKISADKPLSKREQLSSLFMRWIWPEERAEVYFEYGRNDHGQNIREYILEPEKSRAYVFGVRKAFPFNSRKQESLMIGLELADLQQNNVSTVRNAQAWYVNKYIRHGYTNEGQPLGAGIGPGGVLQSIDASWFKGLKRIGLQFERYVHNNDFYYYAYEDSRDFRRHWVDLSIGIRGEWDFNKLIVNAGVLGTRSLNYQWFRDKAFEGELYMMNGLTKTNMQVQAGVMYRF